VSKPLDSLSPRVIRDDERLADLLVRMNLA